MSNTDIQAHRYRFFFVAAIGTFMATLDGSILNIALPTIADDLNVTVDQVAWVALAYSLTMVSLIMIYGAWAQKRGYFFSYKVGFTLFVLGSTICSFTGDLYTLIAGRVIQSSGTAMFAAVGIGLISDVFPPEQRGKAIGLVVMVVGAGFTIGPPLGGVLLSVFDWHSIFLINIPIGVIGLILVFRWFKILPIRAPERELKFYAPIALSIGLVTGVFGLNLMSDYSPGDWRVLTLLGVSMAFGIIFLVFESRPKTALIGFQVFRNRQFMTSIAAMILSFLANAGALILVPFYLERVKGLEPKQVWMYLIIIPIMMIIFAPLSGRLSDKIGFRALTTIGISITATGLFLFSHVDVETASWFVVICLITLGMGNGTFNTPNSSALMGSVTPEERAITSGVMATTRNIGMSVGVAVSTALFAYFQGVYEGQGTQSEVFVMSYRNVLYACMAAAIIAIPLCLTRLNKNPEVAVKGEEVSQAKP